VEAKPDANRILAYYFGEVLRLPPGETRPDHYTLLGLPFFENDHDAIVRAAMDRINLLEPCLADPRPGHEETVEKLIAAMRRAQMTLLDPARRKRYDDRITGHGGKQERAATEDKEAELSPGQMFAGRYRVLGELRRGGLGVVYEALDSNLRTRVQLSVLRPSLSANKIARRRVERAAQSAATLRHPGILEVGEVGEADGLLFVRMRAIEGKRLLQHIESMPKMRLGPDEVRRLGGGIATTLAYAHENGVVHGDLRPHHLFLDDEGRPLIADFVVARAVADLTRDGAPRTRAPEDEASEVADLFSLGCILYQMLAGMPPFTQDTRHYVPSPLPDGVPEDLEIIIMRLLARDPDQRFQSAAEVAQRLTAEKKSRRMPALLAVAAVLVVALAAALFGRGSQGEEVSLKTEVWRLIADEEFDDAIAKLRAARTTTPADVSLAPLLARALEGKAEAVHTGGDPWAAQLLLMEAFALEPDPERQARLDEVRGVCVLKLGNIRVESEPVTDRPSLRIELGDVAVKSVTIGGEAVKASDGVAERAFDLPDGRHEIEYRVEDRAGNATDGRVAIVVDHTPPRLEILEPAPGAMFSKGAVDVRVRVEDSNPPDTVLIRERRVPLTDGEAATSFKLGDGKRIMTVVVRDRAGHETRRQRTIVVDSSAPDLALAARHIVTRDGAVSVRGTLRTEGATVRVQGQDTPVRYGVFEARLVVKRNTRISVEATGPTGIKRRLSVEVVLDDSPPRVSVAWDRRDSRGVLLYGGGEMDAGGVRLRLNVKDTTAVTFVPDEGSVKDGTWLLPAYEGARKARLVLRDEAGNETELVLSLEGHRTTPGLTVKNQTKTFTSDDEAYFDIEGDGTLLFNGKPHEPGRVKLRLTEGRHEIVVQAIDRFGNESRWTKVLHADRTPPRLKLVGPEERGIGRQEVRIEADEELSVVTCFGKSVPVSGKVARVIADLTPDRKWLHVVAKDRAGNGTRERFPLRVVNKVLVLDGRSALLVNMKERHERFTIEFWVRGEPPRGRSILFARAGRRNAYGINWSSEDRGLPFAVVSGTTSGPLPMVSKRAWKWDDWVHFALSYDGLRARFYINGRLQQALPFKEAMPYAAVPIHIGAEPGRSRRTSFFKGELDELRLSSVARYTRAFTPPRYHKEDKDTVLLLRFDTMQGKFVADTSGKGHHASTTGNPKLAITDR